VKRRAKSLVLEAADRDAKERTFWSETSGKLGRLRV
jgi:hypothetical protein